MLTLKKYPDIESLNASDKMVLQQAIASREQAYAPYSHFKVGAAVLLEDGTLVAGNNQENAVYPTGLCAERVAIFSAHANYPYKKVMLMAISCRSEYKPTNNPLTSCGSCRQVMLEYELLQEQPIRVLFYGEDGEVWEVPSTKMLLPWFFDGSAL